jgi:hypothetical protein
MLHGVVQLSHPGIAAFVRTPCSGQDPGACAEKCLALLPTLLCSKQQAPSHMSLLMT